MEGLNREGGGGGGGGDALVGCRLKFHYHFGCRLKLTIFAGCQ